MARELDYLFADLDDDDDIASRLKARRARRTAGALKDGSLNGAVRQRLEAASEALQGAHREILRLLEAQDEMDDDDKSTSASRRAALDRLDGVGRTARAAPVALGGGAETVAYCRDLEWKRLRLLQ